MRRPVLVVHGGAGSAADTADGDRKNGCLAAVAAGWPILAGGGNAVDAAAAAVMALEDNPLFNAGIGAALTESGRVEMDASIMDGNGLAAGAVAGVSRVRNPIALARAVMRDGRQVMLIGDGAEAFARECGLAMDTPETFITPRTRSLWQARHTGAAGTVGAVALDEVGRLAAATSTGGRMLKRDGRVGDSAIIGAGTVADDGAGAASATGTGEVIIRFGLTRMAIELLRDGRDPQWVAKHVIAELTRQLGGEAGIIVLDRFGRIGIARNTPCMPTASRVHGDEARAVD